MKISSRLTVALHTLAVIEYFKDDCKVTSEFIASSVNVNPVVIRRILLSLKDAGIVEVARGSGGAKLKKEAKSVTFLDVYRAVDCSEPDGMFHFHENPNENCPVGSKIRSALGGTLQSAQAAFEAVLSNATLEDAIAAIKERTQQDAIAAEK